MFATVTVGILCGVLVACTPNAPMPVPTATPSATPIPKGDGVLTIGTLLPTTGETAFIAMSQIAGVELAVREINEAGGVNEVPAVVFHQDSGDASTTKAEESFAFLVSKSVDVVIGPSSSILAERLLPATTSAGVVMISPSATSPTLTTLNGGGLLFRTIPSEALEGKAVADVIGKSRVAIIYYSDDAGRAVNDTLAAQVVANGGEVVASEKFSATAHNADKIVSEVKVATPNAVVLASPFSAMKENKAIILALSKAGLGGAKLWLTSQNLADYSQELPEGTLTGVNGILEGAASDADFHVRVKSADPSVSGFRYAAEAYDATILAALAATVAGNDSGRSVANALSTISSSGITCMSFGECLAVLKTRNDIDYDGVSGPISFDEHGDPRSALYGVYKYGADNTYVFVDTVTVE